MDTKSFILSSSGLKNIVQNQSNEEFKFIFGEHEIKINSFFAEFISPYVSKIHHSDPTVNSVHFSDSYNTRFFEQITEEVYSIFNLLINGNSVSVDKDQCFQLQIISILLQNEELYLKLNELFPIRIEIDNIDKIIQYLPLFQCNSCKTEFFNLNEAIQNIASQMYTIDEKKLLKLPMPLFHSIITSDRLTIESEKFFDQNQEEAYAEPTNKLYFYEELELQYLSEKKFNELIENLNYTEMTANLWDQLKKCLCLRKSDKKSSHHYRYKIEFDGQIENLFKGIIHHITDEVGGNVDDKGAVRVTSSSLNKNRLSKYAVDLDDAGHYFQSNDEESAWLQYDFGKRRVRPNSYSIRTRHDQGQGSNHPRSWAIKGSNDETEWKKLDTRENVGCLNSANAVHNFEIEGTRNEGGGFRFLRICQTGLDGKGYHYLTLSALEYFGELISS